LNRAFEKILIKKKLGQLNKLVKGESVSTLLGGFTLEEPSAKLETSEKPVVYQPASMRKRQSRVLNTRDSETKLALRVMKKQRKISNMSGKSLESLNRSISRLCRPNLVSDLQVRDHLLNKSRNLNIQKKHFTDNEQLNGKSNSKELKLSKFKTHRSPQSKELAKSKSNF
jgi:hypothetical protein